MHVLLSEAAALDPRIKRKAFGRDEAADRANQRLSNAAARVNLPHQQAEGEAVAAPQPQSSSQDSAIWQEIDQQVSAVEILWQILYWRSVRLWRSRLY